MIEFFIGFFLGLLALVFRVLWKPIILHLLGLNWQVAAWCEIWVWRISKQIINSVTYVYIQMCVSMFVVITMCLCVRVYLCICMYAYVCVYMYLCIYVCVYVYIYVCVSVYVYMYIYSYMYFLIFCLTGLVFFIYF